MGPTLYRLLKVARRMRKYAQGVSIVQPSGALSDTITAANTAFEQPPAVQSSTPKIDLGITPAPQGARPATPRAYSSRNSLAGGPARHPNSVLSGPIEEVSKLPPLPRMPDRPDFGKPGYIPMETSKSPVYNGVPRSAYTWHQRYQDQRNKIQNQVRSGDMSTYQAQKNMQHWRETNRPGWNGEKLGIPGGNAPTTQGFNYMLRQMAPTGTNAQNLREIRKAWNAATPQMRNTMFSNARDLWQNGYTGKALSLGALQAPTWEQEPLPPQAALSGFDSP